MHDDKAHISRIKAELAKAGATKYGLLKTESRYMPSILHQNEHIGGVVYGQYEGGSGMLVATDMRVIFLDRKPLFMTMDELTYDVVSGVRFSSASLINTVTLHTRISDYTMRYVNTKCARQFVEYIEKMRLEKSSKSAAQRLGTHDQGAKIQGRSPLAVNVFGVRESDFLFTHELGVLTTLEREGGIHGTPVYYVFESGRIFCITKQDTKKSRNIALNGNVGFTVFDADAAQTLHMQCWAEIETDQEIKDFVHESIVRTRKYGEETRLPPVAFLKHGAFRVLKLTVQKAEFTDYTELAHAQ